MDEYDENEPESDAESEVSVDDAEPAKQPKIKIYDDDEEDEEVDSGSEMDDNDAVVTKAIKSRLGRDSDSDASGSESDEDDDDAEEKHKRNELAKVVEMSDDEDSDVGGDEDEDDDNYLQKFEKSVKQNIISDYHPEMRAHNYDEIDILSRVVRNDVGDIVDPLHRTLPFITRYEKARVIGERAKQLNSGATSTLPEDPEVIDGYLIALAEFEHKKIPFIVRRPLPNGGSEYWRVQDLL